MCGICKETTSTIFVFPQEKEGLKEWFERMTNHNHIQLVCMFHNDDALEQIAKSYDLQGFTYQDHIIGNDKGQMKPFFNVLFLRDLVFVTYGTEFAKSMGWEHEAHV
jgi:arginine deiminase